MGRRARTYVLCLPCIRLAVPLGRAEGTYVDWVEAAAGACIAIWVRDQQPWDGISLSDIAEYLGLERDDAIDECLRDAMNDLVNISLADNSRSTIGPDGERWRPTQLGEQLREVGLIRSDGHSR